MDKSALLEAEQTEMNKKDDDETLDALTNPASPTSTADPASPTGTEAGMSASTASMKPTRSKKKLTKKFSNEDSADTTDV